jgi:hypothetical protein
VTRHSDACKNFNCLVPRCDDRDVSRRRVRDHVESSVALDWAAGDAVLAGNVASGSDHWVAHCSSLGGDRALGIILLVAEVSAGCRVVVLLFRRHIRDDRRVDGRLLRVFRSSRHVARQCRKMHSGDQPLTVLFLHGQGEIEGKRELFPILFSIHVSARHQPAHF